MPTYQYACTECGHRFEAVQSFSDDALTDCPECTGRLRKVFNSVGIVFKGSGFYRTDSREKPGGESKPAAGKESAPATSSGAATAEKSSTSATTPASTTSSTGSSTAGSSTAGSAA